MRRGQTKESGSAHRSKHGKLWHHPAFVKFWMGQTTSMFGDQISLLAIPLLAIVTLNASAAEMGLLSATGRLPLLLFGLIAGVWVDRVRRRHLLIGADVGRALLLLALPVMASLGLLGMPSLYVVVFFVGTLAVLFNTAYQALLPSLIPQEQLIEGNSKLTQSRSLAQIAGPGLAGALVQALTIPIAILVDAVSFLVSALFLGSIRREESIPSRKEDRRNTLCEIREGLSFVAQNPLLRASAGSAGTYTLFSTMIVTVSVLYLSRYLDLSSAEIGVLLAAVGPGVLIGASLATRAGEVWGLGPTMIGGLAVAGAANLALPLATGSYIVVMPTLLIASFVNGFGQPFYNINQSSLRQAIVPMSMQGRVGATMQFLAGCAAPLGGVLGGVLGQTIGVRWVLLIGALGTILACLWPICSPVRTLYTLPRSVDAAAGPRSNSSTAQ